MSLATFIPVELQYEDGQIIKGLQPNPIKRHVRDYTLASDPVTITLAGSGTGFVDFVVDQQGSFEWRSIVGTSTGVFSIEFLDNGREVNLQNRALHSNTVIGTARRPFRLPVPYMLSTVGGGRRAIRASLTDLSTSTNTIRLNLKGRRWYQNEAPPDVQAQMQAEINKRAAMYDYWLTTEEAFTLDGSGNGQAIIRAGHEADTEIYKLMLQSANPFTFKIREESTLRTLMSDFIDSRNGMGNAEFPYIFADTYYFERDRFLIIEVEGGTASEELFITMAGRRLRYF